MTTIRHLKDVVKQQLNDFKTLGRQVTESLSGPEDTQFIRKKMHDKCIVLNTARMQLCIMRIRLCRAYLDNSDELKEYTDAEFVDWSMVKFNLTIMDMKELLSLHSDKDPGFVITDYLIQDIRMLAIMTNSINNHRQHINQCKTICTMLKNMIY
jgi:hypothetical protein